MKLKIGKNKNIFYDSIFFQSVRHGFPSKPTAMAWDPELKILAIGSKQGLLRV